MAKDLIIKVPSVRTRVMAWRSRRDRTVVAHGRSLGAVLAKARRAGAKEPVIFFVPEPGKRYIY
jgi:hypothetical protein